MTEFNCQCEDVVLDKTLAAYRRQILIRAGFAAIASNPPPGTADLINAFLMDAQDFLYRQYPALRTRRFFKWTMTAGERFYGMLDNTGGTRQTVTITAASPAVVTWSEAPQNGRTVAFSVAEGDSLPGGLEQGTLYYVVSRTATTCQLALTPGGTAINTSSAGSGTITAYNAPGDGCVFNLEPYKNIEGAWVVDTNGTWYPLIEGIPGSFYTTVTLQGLPQRFEIRQCIEIFPAPNAAYDLYIKGHFGLRPFEIDTDKPTISGELVYLWALANALDYYGKPSAKGVATQAQNYLGNLVAGTHGKKRYVPGTVAIPPAVPPVLLPYPSS